MADCVIDAPCCTCSYPGQVHSVSFCPDGSTGIGGKVLKLEDLELKISRKQGIRKVGWHACVRQLAQGTVLTCGRHCSRLNLYCA